MYGGHITDDWDRHLCRTYLKEYMNQDMFDNVIYLAPGFPLPPALDYDGKIPFTFFFENFVLDTILLYTYDKA